MACLRMAGSRPRRLRSERRSSGGVLEARALELEAADVEPRRRHADLLGEREERQHERDDDGAEDEAQAVGPPAGPEGDADAPPIEGREP